MLQEWDINFSIVELIHYILSLSFYYLYNKSSFNGIHIFGFVLFTILSIVNLKNGS